VVQRREHKVYHLEGVDGCKEGSPEQALWLSVLEHAIADARIYLATDWSEKLARNKKKKKADVRQSYVFGAVETRAAYQWLKTGGVHFQWVCRNAGLDASYVQRKLREAGIV